MGYSLMDIQQLFIALLALTTGILGWFSRTLWDAVVKLKEDLAKLEVKIGTDYVRYDRLQDALKPIMEALREIQETVKQKADKP